MNLYSAVWGKTYGFLDGSLWTMVLIKITVFMSFFWLLHAALRQANPRWRVLLWRGAAGGTILIPALMIAAVMGGLPALELHWRVPAIIAPAIAPQLATVQIENVLPVKNMASRGTAVPGDTMPRRADEAARNAQPEMNQTLGGAPLLLASPATPSTPANIAATTEPMITRTHHLSVGWSLFVLWLGGAALMFFRLWLGARVVRRQVRDAKAAGAPIQEACREVAAALGATRPLEVRVSPVVGSPLLIGLRHPCILLPEALCHPEHARDLPGIFAHEIAHLNSGDLPWNLLLHGLRAVLWFHPLYWGVSAAHLGACEEVCDAVAAGFVGDARSYSQTLARLVVSLLPVTAPAQGIPMARMSDITRRLNLLKRHVFVTPLARRYVCLFLGVGLCLMTALGCVRLMRVAHDMAVVPWAMEHVIHFPSDRSLGEYAFYDLEKGVMAWDRKGQARGDVTVPAGRMVMLEITPDILAEPALLSRLAPDDIQGLHVRQTRTGDTAVRVINEEFLAQLKRLPNLQDLALPETWISEDGFAVISRMRSLKSLMLISTPVDDNDLALIGRLKGLESLWLMNTRVTDRGLAYLANLTSIKIFWLSSTAITGRGLRYLKNLPKLSRLFLDHTAVDDEGLSMTGGWPELTGMSLRGTQVTDAGLGRLKGFLRLEGLDLSDTAVSETGVRELRRALPRCQIATNFRKPPLGQDAPREQGSIESLNLAGSNITDDALARLTSIKTLTDLNLHNTLVTDASLARLKGLRLNRLDLSNTLVTDAGLAHLAQMTTLQHLDLTQCLIYGPGLVHLKNLNNLVSLELCMTGVSDVDLAPLEGLTSLKELELPSTHITDAGLNSIKKLINLEMVCITYCVSPEGLESLHQALPRCRIRGYSPADTAANLMPITPDKPQEPLQKDYQAAQIQPQPIALWQVKEWGCGGNPRTWDKLTDDGKRRFPITLVWPMIEGAGRYVVHFKGLGSSRPERTFECAHNQMTLEAKDLLPGRYEWGVTVYAADGRCLGNVETIEPVELFAIEDAGPKRTNGQRVLLDLSHTNGDIKGWGRYNHTQYMAGELLEEAGFAVAVNKSDLLTPDRLAKVNLLIENYYWTGWPDFRPYLDSELEAIREFVKRGGRLLCVGCDNPEGGGKMVPAGNQLAALFGLAFSLDSISGETQDALPTDAFKKAGFDQPIQIQLGLTVKGEDATSLLAGKVGSMARVKKFGKGKVLFAGVGMSCLDGYLGDFKEWQARHQVLFYELIYTLTGVDWRAACRPELVGIIKSHGAVAASVSIEPHASQIPTGAQSSDLPENRRILAGDRPTTAPGQDQVGDGTGRANTPGAQSGAEPTADEGSRLAEVKRLLDVDSSTSPPLPGDESLRKMLAQAPGPPRALATALASYRVDHPTYPETIESLTTPIAYIDARNLRPAIGGAPASPADNPHTKAETTNTTLNNASGPNTTPQPVPSSAQTTTGLFPNVKIRYSSETRHQLDEYAYQEQKWEGATHVLGTIHGEITWTRDKSPYVVDENIWVARDGLLRVEPGAVVKFVLLNRRNLYRNDPVGVYICGRLHAEGTPDQMIFFGPASKIMEESNPDPNLWTGSRTNQWAGIVLQRDAPPGIVKWCRIESSMWGIEGSGAHLIAHNIFSGNEYGIWLNGDFHGLISHNIFMRQNFGGVMCHTVGPEAFITNNIFYENKCGIEGLGDAAPYADYNLFSGAFPGGGINWRTKMEPGLHDISIDPAFVDAANGDYKLQQNSPARQAGEQSSNIGLDIEHWNNKAATQENERWLAEGSRQAWAEGLAVEQEKPQTARDKFEAALARSLAPEFKNMVTCDLGRVLIAQGRTEDAKKLLSGVIKQSRNPHLRDMARRQMAEALAQSGQPDAAAALLKHLEWPQSKVWVESVRARCMLRTGNPDAVLAGLEQTRQQDFDRYLQTVFHLIDDSLQVGQWNTALKLCDALDTCLDAQQVLRERLETARALFTHDRLEEAQRLLRKSVDAMPYAEEAPEMLALLADVENKYQQSGVLAAKTRNELCTNYFMNNSFVLNAREWIASTNLPFTMPAPNKMILLDTSLDEAPPWDRLPQGGSRLSMELVARDLAGHGLHLHFNYGSPQERALSSDVLDHYGLVMMNIGPTNESAPIPDELIERLVDYVGRGGNLLVIADQHIGAHRDVPRKNQLLARFGLQFKEDSAFRDGTLNRFELTDHPAVKGLTGCWAAGGMPVAGQGEILGTFQGKPTIMLASHGKGKVVAAGLGGSYCDQIYSKNQTEWRMNMEFMERITAWLLQDTPTTLAKSVTPPRDELPQGARQTLAEYLRCISEGDGKALKDIFCFENERDRELFQRCTPASPDKDFLQKTFPFPHGEPLDARKAADDCWMVALGDDSLVELWLVDGRWKVLCPIKGRSFYASVKLSTAEKNGYLAKEETAEVNHETDAQLKRRRARYLAALDLSRRHAVTNIFRYFAGIPDVEPAALEMMALPDFRQAVTQKLNAPSGLLYSVKPQASYEAAEPVRVTFTIRNVTRARIHLRYRPAVEIINFNNAITARGAVVNPRGWAGKKDNANPYHHDLIFPFAEQDIRIEPGQEWSLEVNLADYFDLPPARYSISCWFDTRPSSVRQPDGWSGYAFSDTVVFEVKGGNEKR